jgi:NADH:ubiquinone oxidoreductase subunit 6 (subunit J)
MYSIKLPKEKQKYNRIIWSIVALIGSLKTGITSAEIYFYENIEFVKIFRIVVFVLSSVGIIILLYGVLKTYKSKVKMVDYKDGINKVKVIIIGILFIVYIVITVLPVYEYFI